MVALNGHVLSLLDIIDAFEDGKAMSHTGDTHALEIIMLERNESLTNNLVFYEAIAILWKTNSANKVSTFLNGPLSDDGFWKAVGAAAVAVGSRSMLRGCGELRVYGRMFRIGYGRVVAHASLVFVVGVGLGVGCATIKAHHPDGYERAGDNS
jgi:hypothetical protein